MSDTAFTGSIPDHYEYTLVPVLFTPYSIDMAQRVAKHTPAQILELAAGTGSTTRQLLSRLPSAEITITDLNPAMLATAARVLGAANVTAQACDATSLPFADNSFDAVVATFGVMFFPDRIAAYREARRVLRDSGFFHFNAWGSPATNPEAGIICNIYKREVGEPCFLERVPFAYYDHARIEADLRAAGFTHIDMIDVRHSSPVPSAKELFRAMSTGSPLAADFDHLGARAQNVRAAIEKELDATYGPGAMRTEMSAVIVEAR